MNTDTAKLTTLSSQNGTTPSNIEFEDLIPDDKADFSNYEDALDHAFNSPKLYNIAITGPYGAGKSSILNSYLFSHTNLQEKSIRISLAHFQSTSIKSHSQGKIAVAESTLQDVAQESLDKPKHPKKSSEQIVENLEQLEQLLEGKILNQLIHKLPDEIVRNAGFHSIDYKNNPYFSLFFTSIMCLVLACFFVPYIYIHFAPISLYSFLASISDIVFAILMAFCILFSFLAVFAIYNYSDSIRRKLNCIHHLKVQGNEIELFQSESDPYFDKYLDSIIYMLHHADVEFYIFEDIDRFDITLIFERLKEINELANAKEQNNTENISTHIKSIKFIYLLRDDMFINKERAKFFDFIIPIIPITNTNNSADRLMDILKRYGIDNEVDTDLVMALGFYIEDFRLMKNIANEFRIYYHTIKESNKLDSNKLLAIITYKNLFPKDFSDLQKRQGYVHFLLSDEGKNLLLDKLLDDLGNKKSCLEERITQIENEFLKDKREIAWAILGDFSSYYEGIQTSSNTPISNLEKKINQISTTAKQQYDQRCRSLEDKKNGRAVELKHEIEKLESKINTLKTESFHELAIKGSGITDEVFLTNEKDNNGEEVSFNSIRQNEYYNLLKYLLISGSIDESYGNYTTYFYGEFLSENDQQFIMNVHNNGAPKWTLPLTNCIQIIKNISVAEFGRPCVLNNDLIFQMLALHNHNNKSVSKEMRNFDDKIRNMFTNFHDQYFKYAIIYLNKAKDISMFSIFLLRAFPGIFSALAQNKNLNPEQLEKLTYSVLTDFPKDELLEQNNESGNQLTEYINGNPIFLKRASEYNENQITHLVQCFIDLNIKFKSIDSDGVPYKLLVKVFSSLLFEVNRKNIFLFFTQIKQNNKSASVTKPISLLLQMEQNDEVRTYLEQNWDHFVQSAVENLKAFNFPNFMDESTIITDFINADNPDITLKLNYLEHLKGESIVHLEKLRNIKLAGNIMSDHYDIWQFLIKQNLVQHTDENLYTYITNNLGVDDTLVQTLNKYYLNSPLQVVSNNEDMHNSITNHVISKNEINNPVYEQILSALHAQISDSKILENIDSDKIALIINNKILLLNKDTLEFINQMHPQLLGKFIKCWKTEFDSIINNQPIIISKDAILNLLDSNDFTDEEKTVFIKHSDKSTAIPFKKYMNRADIVQCAILKEHLDVRDLPDIIKDYDVLHKSVQNELLLHFPQFFEIFTTETALSNSTLIHDICKSKNINISLKIRTLIKIIPHESKDIINTLLYEVDPKEYGNILVRGRLKTIHIEQNETNDMLFKALRQAGMIKSFSKQRNFGYSVIRNNVSSK